MPQRTYRLLAATAFLLVAIPASANAASGSVRAFGAGGGTFRLALDGRTKTPAVHAGETSRRFSARTGRHTFSALSASGRRLAKARFRISKGHRYTIAFARDAHGRARLVLVAEATAGSSKAAYRIANLTTAGADFTVGDPALRVAHGLPFGATTATLQISGTASATGLMPVNAVRGVTTVGTSTLVDATGSATTFALVPSGAASKLVRLPWDKTPPVPLTQPTIAGTEHVGSSVTCSGDTWTGGPSVNRHWTADGVDLAGATGSSLALAQATHAGKTIGCRVVATRAGQTVTLRPAGFALPLPPANVTPPTVSGAATLGAVVTCEPGAWTGDSDVPTYRWLADGTSIPGQTGSTYTLADPGDGGLSITCEETAGNAGGVTSVASSNAKIGGAPANTALPTLAGTFQGGNTITVVDGTWDPANATLTHTWYECRAGSCDAIDPLSHPDTSYDLTDFDTGATIYVVETAADAVDPLRTDSARTADSDVVIAQAPEVSLAAPDSITSTSAGLGATVTPHGLDADITVGFSTDTSYGTPATPVPATVPGSDPTGDVTASLSGLTPSTVYHYHVVATSTSGATDSADVADAAFESAPAPDSGVTITGTEAVGQDLTCDPGTWSGDAGSENTYTFRWLRNGVAIDGETQSTYTLASADSAGGTTAVTCEVTASNDGFGGLPGGSTVATSSNSVVLPAAPDLRNEAVTGTTSTSTTLTGEVDTHAQPGEAWFEWGADTSYGNTTPHVATSGNPGFEAAAEAAIPDAGLLDPSTEYHFRLDALNAGGETDGADHTFVTAPEVSGDSPSLIPVDTSSVKLGDMVACVPGDWTEGAFPNTFTYAWWRSNQIDDPVQIPGETGTSYTMAAADAGFSVFCTVTATNIGGATTYATQTVDLPAPPTPLTPPTLSYTTLNDGDTITANPGTYDNAELGQGGEWVRCDADGISNCASIPGETGPTYTVNFATDQGSTIRFRETAVNRGGQTTVDSDPTIPI